ncbi:hypothetical protein GEMRC1_003140 [Eukaryota sp. GEM-RC1]
MEEIRNIVLSYLDDITPRPYQEEVFEESLNWSVSVINMRTNSGKTLCAFMRMILSKHLTDLPSLFVAPKRALLDQHRLSFVKQTKLSNVARFYGSSTKPNSLSEFSSYDAVFVTPGWLVNNVLKFIPFPEFARHFSLLVVDEIHHAHADSKSPHAQLIFDHWLKSNEYHELNLLGLTASVVEVKGDPISSILEFLNNIQAELVVPVLHAETYESLSNPP